MKIDRKIVHTRHVLAVKDLAVAAADFKDQLGFDLDFTAPSWGFLSFGEFKVMLAECSDEMTAEETGNYSWFAHALVENVNDVYAEFNERGAEILSPTPNKPWAYVSSPSLRRTASDRFRTANRLNVLTTRQ